MACDKKTCKVCKRIARFRAFKSALPNNLRESFEQWFEELDSDLEIAYLEIAQKSLDWRRDQPRYADETELRYQNRLKEWEEYKNEH